MAKWILDAILDLPLAEIATGTRITVCSAQPANFAGIAAVLLAEVVVTPGHGNGDFTIGNGDASGRKVAIAAQVDLPIDADGDATHVAVDDGSELLAVTTCVTQTLTTGGEVTVPTHDYEFADPI